MAVAARPLCLLLAWLGLPAISAGAEVEDPPYVEILQDLGAIDGPADGPVAAPNWERVRLDLKIANRLAHEVRAVEIEVNLVHATVKEAAVPGWIFPHEIIEDTVLSPTTETYLRLSLALPPRRSSPPAEEIAYRVHIVSYRVHPPDLETSLRLLASSAPSDQRAALNSYALGKGQESLEIPAATELADSLSTLPASPTAPDALRMLFAVQALGALGAAEHVHTLLGLIEQLPRAPWGRAVLELATRMVAASHPDEPRLLVLPSWARSQSALLTVRAEDALEEALRDTLLRMGDAAVPGLLLASQTSGSTKVRALSRRILHALGRSTVRSQLSLRNRDHRLQVIHVFGEIGAPDPVAALIEVLRARDSRLRESARRALLKIGGAAVSPLVDALGEAEDEQILQTLEVLSQQHGPQVLKAAEAYGVHRVGDEKIVAMLARLRARLGRARQRNLETELDHALKLGPGGDYGAAIRRLDAVFEQDKTIYMGRAADIARLYVDRARQLQARGDFDAAAQTAQAGLSIVDTPAGQAVLLDAQLALVQGYTQLGDLDTADAVLTQVRRSQPSEALRKVEGELLMRKAADAFERGDSGLARALVDRARMMGLQSPELQRTHEKLLFAENLAVVVGMSLFAPALVLMVVLYFRRRMHRTRMARLTQAIDEGS